MSENAAYRRIGHKLLSDRILQMDGALACRAAVLIVGIKRLFCPFSADE
jgi:hypothetical protein